MKKQLFALLLFFCCSFVSAQEKKPIPACTDMKAVLQLIKTATTSGNLLDFKNEETGKDGDYILYSSNLELCDQKGELNDDKYQTTITFEFKSKWYTGKLSDLMLLDDRILRFLKVILDKWEFETISDNDPDLKSDYYSFYELGNNLGNKNDVTLITHYSEDDNSYSFKLKFHHSK